MIAAALKDSQERAALSLDGRFVDLTDPALAIREGLSAKPGEYLFAADLSRYPEKIAVIGGSARIENYVETEHTLSFLARATEGAQCALRVKCPPPARAEADCEGFSQAYDEQSGTMLMRFPGSPAGARVTVSFL